jgi:MerR family transcriptional regulator, mercuric resistance operon regulatory protein
MRRFTIGTLAAASGVKITTIRYYERSGLMPQPPRSAGQHRHYTDDHLQRLVFICRARMLGFSIEDIRKLLVLADAAGQSCPQVEQLAAAHLEKLRNKIAVLKKLETLLSGAVAQCSGTPNTTCPVLELLESADQGDLTV